MPSCPRLVHCVAGRHRTGIVTACTLDLVGIEDDAIAVNYALSGVRDDSEAREADPRNSLIFLESVRKKYGSTRWMLLRFGLSDADFDRLEAAMLETVP